MSGEPVDGLPRRPDPARPFDPPPIFENLRETQPICPVRLADGSVAMLASSYGAVRGILGDLRFSADVTKPGFPLEGHVGGKIDVFARSLIRRDEPEHSRLRRVVADEFRPDRVGRFSGMVQSIVDGCLDRVRKAGPPSDLVAAFTSEVPSLVICRFLGIPDSLRPRVKQLALAAGSQPVPGKKHALEQLADTLHDYLKTVKGDENSPVLFGKLVAAVERSDLTEEELVSMAVLLTLGGHETTANTLALGLARILMDRELYGRLRDRPDLIPAAVEEILRLTAVVRAGPRRVAVKDVTVAGHPFAKGTGVILSLHAANYDDAFVQTPGAFRLGRERAQGHMTFGFGLHQCLGQFLARLELSIAFRTMLAGLDELTLVEPLNRMAFDGEATMYGLKELKVRWREG